MQPRESLIAAPATGADGHAAAGRPGEAAARLEIPLDRSERKHNFAMVEQVRERLTQLRDRT